MSVLSFRIAASALAVGLFTLTSCAGPAGVRVGTADFYWSAAKETYAAGDYSKTADHLEHLVEGHNAYTGRAIPWYFPRR